MSVPFVSLLFAPFASRLRLDLAANVAGQGFVFSFSLNDRIVDSFADFANHRSILF